MLVGREAERRALDGLVAQARLGRSGVLVLVGEAGMGKTTLLDYVAGRAEDMDVVRVVGAEAEHDLPFGTLGLVLHPTTAELDRLPPPQAFALRVALALQTGEPADRFAVGAATLAVLAQRAETRPVALLMDDAHHFDRPSAEALVFAARRLLADAVLIVAAVRSDRPTPLRSAGLPELALAGLDEPATAALLDQAGSAAGRNWAASVHSATGGNPLAILELARDPGRATLAVPATLAEGFLGRARAIGPAAVTLLALAEAAAGDLRVVARAAAALDAEVDELETAEAAGLVALEPERVVFTHPLVGSSAYADLPAERRRAVHRAIVAALPEDDHDRRAWHRAAAAVGPDEDIAAALDDAAETARARAAYAVAAAAHERAARLSDAETTRGRRLVAAARAAWDAGDSGWATRILDEALSGVLPSPSRSEALALRGAVATRSGSLLEAWTVLTTAARQLAEEDPDHALVLVGEAVDVAFYLADGDLAREGRQLAESLLHGGLRDETAGIGHLVVGIAQVLDGGDGEAELRRGVRLLAGAPSRPGEGPDALWKIFGPLFLREEGASRGLVRAVEEARAETSVGALPHLLFHLARDEATTDRWGAAGADYAEAMALADELGQSTEAAMSLAGLAWLEARQGHEDASRHHAALALDVADRRQVVMATVWATFALGDLELAAGRVQAAVERYLELDRLLDVSRARDVDLSPAPELVEVLLRAGDRAAALDVAHRHQDRARAKGLPWSLARAGRASGLLASDGDLDDTFGPALALHALTPDVFETARTQLAYGARLRRARRRVDARVPLQQAYETFARVGARPWAAVAADELEATGATVTRPGESGLDLLTPRERQIVGLLVEGRTTREASSALFLSPKTVEYHLRHVYTKLGIAGRRELTLVVGSGTSSGD